MASEYCRCLFVCSCVRVHVNPEFVRAITCNPFKPGSPNLDQRLRSLLFWVWLTLTFIVKFNLKCQNLVMPGHDYPNCFTVPTVAVSILCMYQKRNFGFDVYFRTLSMRNVVLYINCMLLDNSCPLRRLCTQDCVPIHNKVSQTSWLQEESAEPWNKWPRAMCTARIMALIMLQRRGSMRTMHGFGTELIRSPAIWLVESRNYVNWFAYRVRITHYYGTVGDR